MSRIPALLSVALAAVLGCSSGNAGGDAGACVPDRCRTDCEAAGFAIGACAGDLCQCSGRVDADADDDSSADSPEESDAGPEADALPDDVEVGDAEDEVEVDPCAIPSCGPTELCGELARGDGLDNDCDTQVDEDCDCVVIGSTLECFPGDPAVCPAGQPCGGGCTRGVETCTEFRTWSPCFGAVPPEAERCDGVDNDCDGLWDEDISGCDAPVECPDTRRVAPLTYVPLQGSSIFSGPFDAWEWRLFCPPTVVTCPTPADPAAQDTEVLLLSSGTYRVRATIRAGTETYTCEYAIVAQGQGLRVELTWDTQGSANGDTDVDLHLHQWGPEDDFFTTPQDCFYLNCKASSFMDAPLVDWGLPHTTDLAACRDAPQNEGSTWVLHGFCANPRLDVDVISCTTGVTDPTSSGFCAPENINVDEPPLGEPMRVLVNYYSQHEWTGVTNADVNIYCGGVLRAAFGPQELTFGGDYGRNNDNWLVADVRFYTDACGAIDCEIVPLDVVQRGPSFGPTWSTFSR
ncbi:MAG: hypothetical protein HY907_07485 [Deltaproteobacteria bacterium]|nr:hypothetical protein [Deltaproteobacteria bacterium]